MKTRILLSMILLCCSHTYVLGAAADAESDGKVIEKRVEASTLELFAPVAIAVRAEMVPGGRYEFMSLADRAKVSADLDAMGSILQKSGSVANMSDEDRVRLFNIQERVNGILTHSDRYRIVCERRAPTGSNFAITTCKTLAEMEDNEHAAQKLLQRAAPCVGHKQCTTN